MSNILIIDDDSEIRFVLRESLEKQGYTVYEAEDGREGLITLSKMSIDLVITDLIMPKVDGFEIIKKIRREHPNIRIIATTGASYSGSKLKLLDRARHLGTDCIIPKPVDLKDVSFKIDELLTKREIRPTSIKKNSKERHYNINNVVFILIGIVIGFIIAMIISSF